MSWGMNMKSQIRKECSIPIDDWMYEIWTINNHGWEGKDRFDFESLEIVKYPVWIYGPIAKTHLSQSDLDDIKKRMDMNACFLNVAMVEQGKCDGLIASDPYYAREIGDIEPYKRAIKRFRGLLAFL
jgi:hypothetical protein